MTLGGDSLGRGRAAGRKRRRASGRRPARPGAQPRGDAGALLPADGASREKALPLGSSTRTVVFSHESVVLSFMSLRKTLSLSFFLFNEYFQFVVGRSTILIPKALSLRPRGGPGPPRPSAPRPPRPRAPLAALFR